MLKSALFLAALLVPFATVAGPGNFIFEVNGVKETYPTRMYGINKLPGQ